MSTLIKKPQTQRGKNTLNNILSAAVQVFYEKGYHNASISDITSLAGVASGTFYVYFDGKYNLYKYLMLKCSHMIRKHLSKSIKNCKTRREAERVGLKSWIEFILKNQYMYHIIWESMYIDSSIFQDYYITFCEAYMKGLREAEDSGEVLDIDPEVLAYTLMGASNFIGLRWCLFDENTPPEEVDYVVDEFMKILDNGIFSKDKGNVENEEKNSGDNAQQSSMSTRFRFQMQLDDDDYDEEDPDSEE